MLTMKSLKVSMFFLSMFVIILCILLLQPFFAPKLTAQNPLIEQFCPSGFSPLPGGQTVNNQTGKFRQWLCVDYFGNVNIQGVVGATGTPGNPGAPGSNGGTGGAALLSGVTSPGMFLGGPVPQPSGVNPFFETSSFNSQANPPGSSTATISGTPATATSTAIFITSNNSGSHNTTPPDASWNTIDTATWFGDIFYKNLSSANQLNVSEPITGGTNGWLANLGFFGGTITNVANAATLGTSCGTGCIQGTATLTAGHLELLVFQYSASLCHVTIPTVSDSGSNPWVKMGDGDNGSGTGLVAFTSQVINGGSQTITANGNTTLCNLGTTRVYDLTGPTAYYAGAIGPYTFRYITPQDLPPGLFPTGVLKYFTQNLGADVASLANNSNTVLLTQAVIFPSSGCPCRADIKYSLGVNSGNSHLAEGWISDGTNQGGSTSTEYVNTGLTISTSADTIFPNSSSATYSNGQSVTFTLNLSITTLAAGSVTAKQLGPGGRQATWMQIAILPTQN